MNNTKLVMDINEIVSVIPHRYPMLLVDKIIDLHKGEKISGIKNITMNEPQFTGHFPDRPVMPGVLIIEAMAQLSAVLVAKSMESTKGKEVFFMSIEEAKFRKIVEPGDCMIMHSNIIQNRGNVWKFKAFSEVDGKVAAEATFTAMVRDKTA
ncbi:MAG: 3-hydroxyacyl-ACP dehydratase FabZ [Rickettsiales bacterium]|nr:3-hydroxyacyl-ACP dehydratase FabZ [Rickettsiales bacterium]MCA0254292.1 3-hydroxyacyl-ACP dehydratase FabZ [Pseudomonadota bacterium]